MKPKFYKQYDKKYASHGNGKGQTIGRNGCGPSACANVIAALVDSDITPIDTWDWFCKHNYMTPSGSIHAAIPACLKHWGIKTKETRSVADVRNCIKSGGWAVTLMGPGRWTRGGHFIVPYGIHHRDKLYVSDSGYSDDYHQKNGSLSDFRSSFIVGWLIKDLGDGASGGSGNKGKKSGGFRLEDIDDKFITPYVLTIGREDDPKEFECKEWKENRVLGVILEAGYYFDKNHVPVKSFRNRKLYDQCKKIVSHNFEFGYFFNGRAKSAKEVEKEIYEFSFITRKYAPTMGVWIVADFLKRKKDRTYKKFNDGILAAYEKELIRLGLTGRIGIYCKHEDLKYFSWDKLQEKWWLWLNDPVKKIDNLNGVLDPRFFDTDNKSGELPENPSVQLYFGPDEEVTSDAVKWAKKIANNNDFAYGVGKRSHNQGCYFCGTNRSGKKKAKKGSKWEKTYCSSTFICAAYVHGGKIRKRCWNSGVSVASWTKHGFTYIGTNVPKKKLEPGDVILTKSHVSMYIGDGKIVHARKEGWGNDTIVIGKFSPKKPYNVVRYMNRNYTK